MSNQFATVCNQCATACDQCATACDQCKTACNQCATALNQCATVRPMCMFIRPQRTTNPSRSIKNGANPYTIKKIQKRNTCNKYRRKARRHVLACTHACMHACTHLFENTQIKLLLIREYRFKTGTCFLSSYPALIYFPPQRCLQSSRGPRMAPTNDDLCHATWKLWSSVGIGMKAIATVRQTISRNNITD
jgi:hypothetical protein